MRNFMKNILLLIAFIIPGSCIHAEENSDTRDIIEDFNYETVSQKEPVSQRQADTNTLQLVLINNNQNYVLITASLFTFTLLVITFLMKITPHQPNDIITIIGLVSVIFGTILLVLVVDTTETLTAPMGILGAIAGYLFGSAQKNKVSESSSE